MYYINKIEFDIEQIIFVSFLDAFMGLNLHCLQIPKDRGAKQRFVRVGSIFF